MSKSRFELAHHKSLGVDIVSADSSHSFGRHTHDQFGVGIILRGAQKSHSGRGQVRAEAGDLITVNPAEVHDGQPIGDGGRSWQMIYFDPVKLAPLVNDLTEGLTGSAEFSLPVLRDAETAKCFRALIRAVAVPEHLFCTMEARELLLLLLVRLLESSSAEVSGYPAAIKLARDRIDEDPSAPLTLQELAAMCGLSQYQLVRGFSTHVGLTPHAYLVQRRLHHARKMIASGASLANAALASGFSDQSHMNRQFVKAYGASPGLYASAMK
ncbi:AraC family transcriptional regulator [Pseudomonas kuykendallii]|uniref:AraC family transcriptional regulator n=1 Tax=Pseudomonas kuykendallii TaxID=1007099 RepID=A0A2W5D305_9PSED|nr:MAG: AraC family transcriptional regulator [Pseudomonas kuykendallii]